MKMKRLMLVVDVFTEVTALVASMEGTPLHSKYIQHGSLDYGLYRTLFILNFASFHFVVFCSISKYFVSLLCDFISCLVLIKTNKILYISGTRNIFRACVQRGSNQNCQNKYVFRQKLTAYDSTECNTKVEKYTFKITKQR